MDESGRGRKWTIRSPPPHSLHNYWAPVSLWLAAVTSLLCLSVCGELGGWGRGGYLDDLKGREGWEREGGKVILVWSVVFGGGREGEGGRERERESQTGTQKL